MTSWKLPPAPVRPVLLLFALVFHGPGPVCAQESSDVVAGARLRVQYSLSEAREQRVGGNLLDADSAVLRLREGQNIQTLLWDRIRRVQVSTRPRSAHAETIGAVIGGFVGLSIFKQWADARYLTDEWNGAGAATIGLPAGAVAGYVAGRLLGVERWRTVAKASLLSDAAQSNLPATCRPGI
jgi:hypothetical protein